jgi:large subunit ribosomal protein L21
MTYAVIALQGKQYKVEQGQVLTVDLLERKVGEKMEVSDVLLVSDGKKVKVGTPLVEGAKVTLKVLESGKDEKLRVFKYKAKSKYRKTIGHRQSISNVEVTEIKG